MEINDLRVAVIGGTGDEGRGLALRWAMAGARVIIGSRTEDRARAAADELKSRVSGLNLDPALNLKAAQEADFVLLAVPFDGAASTLDSIQSEIRDTAILIDATVPVVFEKGRVRYLEPEEGSASEHLRARLKRDIPLVAAFKTMPAHLLLDEHEPLDCDEFVAGDSRDARLCVMEAMSHIEGLRPLDAGTLESARTLERMTVLAIGINRRQKVKTSRFRVVGL